MRIFWGIIVFLAPTLLFAQNSAATNGCGPNNVQFSVKISKEYAPTQPEKGKALVFVFATEEHDERQIRIGHAITRVGVDGTWVGANQDSTYFAFSLDPGRHHICTNWQSSIGFLHKMAGAITFDAEAGKTYYFETKIDERTDRPQEIRLEHLDPDDGESLISNSTYITSQAKR